jgi:integrating conjugative element protein (TIGR03765 family)
MTARRHLLTCALGMAAFGLPMRGRATGLRVAHDAGGGVPYEQWLAQSTQDGAHSGTGQPTWAGFPLRTPGLRPGVLKQTRRWKQTEWLTQPFAVVGSDAMSRRWLTRHGAALETMGARVIVVECPDAAAFRALQVAAGALPLAPLVKPWLVDRLMAAQATVVPLLITPNGSITQRPDALGSGQVAPTGPEPRP